MVLPLRRRQLRERAEACTSPAGLQPPEGLVSGEAFDSGSAADRKQGQHESEYLYGKKLKYFKREVKLFV